MTEKILLNILLAVATYYVLTRKQVGTLCLPGFDDRTVRKYLLQLVQMGYLGKCRMEVVSPSMGAPAPVYFPTRKGVDYLVAELHDDRFYSVCTQRPNWQHMYHWIRCTDFHMLLDRAVALQHAVEIECYRNEWDVCNPEETEAHKRYHLFTLLREKPRLVFAPDGGFVVCYLGFKRALFVEIDRSTSGIMQISASKSPGAAEMARIKGHARLFPQAALVPFGMILVTDTPGRRDALARSFSKREGGQLWRFSCWPDLKPETILFEPVWRDIEGQAVPLVKRV